MNNKQKPTCIEVNSKKYQLQAHAYLKHELSMDDGQASNILSALSIPLRTSFEAVEEAHENRNLKTLAEAAHSLKGALLNMGLNELAEKVKRIEESSVEGESVLHTKRLTYIHGALQHMIGEVAS
ncbi:MAG TPA: Hpt domain-containing protein [Leucothrix mucor]|nr:Hpt domain-containing protein [Leucothrix mucor]